MQKKPTSAILSVGYFLDKDVQQTITNLEEMGITNVCLIISRYHPQSRVWFTTTELRKYLGKYILMG